MSVFFDNQATTISFGYSSGVTANDKPRVQNEALRKLALDNLANEFDELGRRAQRAASTLRTLRPMLPTAERR